MTCKYRGTVPRRMPPEGGGKSGLSQVHREPGCTAGRPIPTIGGGKKCEAAPRNGPCPFWYRPEPDPLFRE